MAINPQAQSNAQPTPLSDNSEEWDEERLEEALARVKELHIKLRDLRSTIPRLIQPLARKPYPPPDVLFSACQAAMTTAHKDVSEFRQQITSEESKKVLQYAEQSRSRDPKGIKPWRASDDPEWAVPKS